MLSFRQKIIVWSGSALFFLTFVVTGAILVCVLFQLYHHEQEELRELSASILRAMPVAEFARPSDQQASSDSRPAENVIEVKDLLAKNIDNKLAFLFDPDDLNLAYTIYDHDGKLLHQYRTPAIKLTHGELHSRRGLSVKIESYKDWTFYYLAVGEHYDVLVSSFHHIEMVDKIAIGILIIIPLNVLLSIVLGYYLSNKVLVPFRYISETASRIEKGDFSARIPEIDTGDEVAVLIKKLNHTFSRLRAVFEQISQFSSDAAHELKTPLTAIRGNLEVIVRRARTQQEYEDVIYSTIDDIAGLNRIVDQLLLLARTETDTPLECFHEFDFSRTAELVLEQLKIIAEDREVELDYEIEPNIRLLGVEVYASQLCYNLIHNAIKFSAKKERVEVRLRRESGGAVLVVLDHGVGIAQEYQKRIFDRFFQVDESRQTGTGLGLSLVRGIVATHKGSIELKSQLGEGAEFTVRIPLSDPSC